MATNIGKIDINFQVASGDPQILTVEDFSQWRVIEDLPAYIHITLPGSRKPIDKIFHKNKKNGFNSLNLELSCHVDCEDNRQNLPDGIYDICVTGGANGQHSFQRYYLKTDLFQIQLDKAWTKLGLEYDTYNKQFRDTLLYAEGFIRAAEANTRLGNIPEAQDFYKLAKSKIEAYLDCKDCI